MYLACSIDNSSKTVLKLFEEAVAKWGLPSRARGDMGVENRSVAHYMLNHPARGPSRESYNNRPQCSQLKNRKIVEGRLSSCCISVL